MWLDIIIVELVALSFLLLSIYIGKGNIELIHEYHRRNVKEEDRVAYGKALSKGLLAIAVGCFLSGILNYFEVKSGITLSIFGGIVVGFFFFNKAQKTYNGKWFS